jgi:hypothetical protein
LIDERPAQPELAAGGPQDEIALSVHVELVGALEVRKRV